MNIKKTSQKGQNDTEVVTKTTLIPMTLSNKNKKNTLVRTMRHLSPRICCRVCHYKQTSRHSRHQIRH